MSSAFAPQFSLLLPWDDTLASGERHARMTPATWHLLRCTAPASLLASVLSLALPVLKHPGPILLSCSQVHRHHTVFSRAEDCPDQPSLCDFPGTWENSPPSPGVPPLLSSWSGFDQESESSSLLKSSSCSRNPSSLFEPAGTSPHSAVCHQHHAPSGCPHQNSPHSPPPREHRDSLSISNSISNSVTVEVSRPSVGDSGCKKDWNLRTRAWGVITEGVLAQAGRDDATLLQLQGFHFLVFLFWPPHAIWSSWSDPSHS